MVKKFFCFFEVQSYSKFGREKFGPFRSSVVRSWVVRSWVVRSWVVRSWVVRSWVVRRVQSFEVQSVNPFLTSFNSILHFSLCNSLPNTMPIFISHKCHSLPHTMSFITSHYVFLYPSQFHSYFSQCHSHSLPPTSLTI
jgi:hypothetical protein